jgi:hypothetical protein
LKGVVVLPVYHGDLHRIAGELSSRKKSTETRTYNYDFGHSVWH